MKVLWICNAATPKMAEALEIGAGINTSWIVNVSENIKDKVELSICCPIYGCEKIKIKESEGITYIAIPRKSKKGIDFEKGLTDRFDEIIKTVNPDKVHIWGTEFPHSYNAILACEENNLLDNTFVYIQGMVSVIAKHFMEGIPEKIRHKYTLRDLIKRKNLIGETRDFERRGYYEIETIKKSKHVIGRTDWDEACVKQINPLVDYNKNNETLREEFYKEECLWNYERCEKHTIFMSQGGYPLKGFHRAIEALYILKRKYPDIKLYITGQNIMNYSVFQNMKENYYTVYYQKIIKKYDLTNNIIFLGRLSAGEMVQQYNKANVYIMPSTIENSPNSMGEAMLVGVPVVVSDVGGVKNLLRHEEEGFIYQSTADYMLAYYIDKVFEQCEQNLCLINKMTELSRKHALKTHDFMQNIDTLVNIYSN